MLFSFLEALLFLEAWMLKGGVKYTLNFFPLCQSGNPIYSINKMQGGRRGGKETVD